MKDELEDMKNLWQNASAQPGLDEQQIEALLALRSKNAFSKLRQNLLIEAIFGLFLIGLLIFGATASPNEHARFAAALILLVTIPLYFFYYYALRNLQKGLSFGGNLKDSLKESLAFWRQALSIYFWGGVLLIPIVFIAARWWRFSVMSDGNLQFFTGSSWMIAFKITVFWTLLSALLYGLIHLSYGRYVGRLKKCLQEIEAVE